MTRREFIAGVGSAAAWPLVARAQQNNRLRVVGLLINGAESDPANQARLAVVRDGLQKLGWTEGRNLRLEVRWGTTDAEPANVAVTDLIGLAPDVIITGGLAAFEALRRKTETIPVVFVNLADPVTRGLVSSIASSGTNITGFTAYEFSIAGKWLAVLKELAPDIKRVAFVIGASIPGAENFYRSLHGAAEALAVEPTAIRVADIADLEQAINQFAVKPGGGLICAPLTFTFRYRAAIIDLAARYRLPAVYPFREFVSDGGLAFYGIDFLDLYRGATSYTARILRGAKPADLPIQAPTKFELAVNLKTARALGLTVPASLLARADEVIE
jgi:putative ABC transport system substrate-binding protein